MSFIVLSLPRSRSFWLSRFLSYRDWYCGHDEIKHLRSLDDVKSWFAQPYTGTVETSGAHWWRLIDHYAPDTKIVTVRRPVDQVLDSLERAGFQPSRTLTRQIEQLNHKLDQIENRRKNVLSIQHQELCDFGIRQIWEYVLPYPFDDDWYGKMRDLDLQVDMPALVRYYQAHEAQLVKLTKMAKGKCLSLLAKRPQIEPDGLIIQQEPFEDFLRDGVSLFAEHSRAVDEAPDSYLTKNIPIMQKLAEMGALQVTTARCNGRMFGYLMAIISPSLEDREMLSGLHTLFYASNEFKNLGMKLQRASVAAMKERGVGEVFLRAGIRGAGDRIGVLYKRMGAEDFGQMYRLNLNS